MPTSKTATLTPRADPGVKEGLRVREACNERGARQDGNIAVAAGA